MPTNAEQDPTLEPLKLEKLLWGHKSRLVFPFRIGFQGIKCPQALSFPACRSVHSSLRIPVPVRKFQPNGTQGTGLQGCKIPTNLVKTGKWIREGNFTPTPVRERVRHDLPWFFYGREQFQEDLHLVKGEPQETKPWRTRSCWFSSSGNSWFYQGGQFTIGTTLQ